MTSVSPILMLRGRELPGHRYRYQTPRNWLIYRSFFGNDERVTDSPPILRIQEREYLGAFEGDESRESRSMF